MSDIETTEQLEPMLYLCATPIGNLSDITLRTIDTLKGVSAVYCEDTRRTLQLLNHFGIQKPLTSYHEHNKREKGEYITGLLKQGKNVVLVSDAGTPAISDPGEDLVKLCTGLDRYINPGLRCRDKRTHFIRTAHKAFCVRGIFVGQQAPPQRTPRERKKRYAHAYFLRGAAQARVHPKGYAFGVRRPQGFGCKGAYQAA